MHQLLGIGCCLLVAGLFGPVGFLGSTPAAAAPRLEIAQPVHDFGDIFEDQPLEHIFTLKNAGDAPLQIKNIELDCACSAVDYDRLVPPGGGSKIVFKVKPYSALHKFCKKGQIFSNDPTHPVMTIQLCGNSKPFIEIQPSHVVRFTGQPHENLVSRVRLISHQKTPLTIKGFETDLGDKVGGEDKRGEAGAGFRGRDNQQNERDGRLQGQN